ncbi:hypothetical protein ADK74_17150 [Streptomyces decoyicus]|nr:hypothetical protein ADK74_17150 [Streptomyces decoyicus]
MRRRGFRGSVGAGAMVRRTGMRAVRRPTRASAPEPSTAGAAAAVTAVVIVLPLTLTGMVAQLFPEPQRDRTAGTE